MSDPTPITDAELAAMEQRFKNARGPTEACDSNYRKHATLISEAREFVPRLIRALRAERAEVERLQSELARVIQDRDARRERLTLCLELESENARLRERLAALEVFLDELVNPECVDDAGDEDYPDGLVDITTDVTTVERIRAALEGKEPT